MPIAIFNTGRDNVLEVALDVVAQGSGSIRLSGDGNRAVIRSPSPSLGLDLHLHDGADVTIGAQCHATHLFIHATRGARVRIGEGVGFNGAVRLLLHEPATLTIGDGCLIAGETDVTVSDMHSIVDVPTRARLNPARDISIGDRVWIGQRCMVLKGACIGAGAVVGAGSVVTRAIPADCVAAGNPARVVRRNATWDFRLL